MVYGILIVVGFVMLIKGADWFVDGAAGIASYFGLPSLVIGLTIVAMGTSTPEAAVSIVASIKGNPEITIGNILGSNILNLLLVLGVTALFANILVQRSTLFCELPFLIFISVLLGVFGITGHGISRKEGFLLLYLFGVYLFYMFVMAQRGKEESVAGESQPIPRSVFFCLLGVGLVIWGSDVTVDAATELARQLGMSNRFIGLTIVAFGTSLPELVTSVVAAKKGNADIAIGNIVGSNLFNGLFIVGTAAAITPLPFAGQFLADALVAAAAAALLLLGTVKKRQLTRPLGAVMLLCYIGYFWYIWYF